jgi:RNA polymerase sigma factor (sigma-70 family)
MPMGSVICGGKCGIVGRAVADASPARYDEAAGAKSQMVPPTEKSDSESPVSPQAAAGGGATELLLPKVAKGEAGAVRACIDRFGGLVWSLARRMTFSDAEAEDAVQEIFIEVWQSAYRYDVNVASETAFVAMIARRRLIDRRRKIARRPVYAHLAEGSAEGSVGSADVGPDAMQTSEDAERASAAMSKLSTEQQRVLRLSIFHGLSHEKIARSTGLPLGTVKTHARRGLIRIRELLEAEAAGSAGVDAEQNGQSGSSPKGGVSEGGAEQP